LDEGVAAVFGITGGEAELVDLWFHARSARRSALEGEGAMASDEAPPSPKRLCPPLPGVAIMSRVEAAPPAQVGYAQEAMQQLREAIRHLPPKEKEVFRLRQQGELTYEQIAQLDNRSVVVVKEQMRNALRKLRRVVQEVSSGKHARSF
jgi:RNA polymerase sigma factor (sigma-70 family)